MAIEFRPIVESELLAFIGHMTRAFGGTSHDERTNEILRPAMRYQDTQAAFDGDELVGTLHHEPEPTTVLGGASLPTAGITRASVAPTHRRRGILTGLMTRLLAQAHEAGNVLATLYASETPIYGRFGFGLGTVHESWSLERREAAFASWAPGPEGSVRFIAQEEAGTVLPPIFDAYAAARPGNSPRLPFRWTYFLLDPPEDRHGASPLNTVVYTSADGVREGYAVYRLKGAWPENVPAYELAVQELIALSSAAERELWRYLIGVDLVRTLKVENQPTDATLPWLLADYRQLRRRPGDGLYVRVMDVPAAFGARTYVAEGRVVIDVPQDAACPWVTGRYAIEASRSGAHVSKTDATPDLTVHAAALGTLLLGTQPASILGRAGLIDESRPGALALADALFHSPIAPLTTNHF